MKDRKPFELKNTLIIYNIVQVILSVILVVEVSVFMKTQRRHVDNEERREERKKVTAAWHSIAAGNNIVILFNPRNDI